MPKEARYHCNNCNVSFSITTGTLFHKTKLDLQKWFYAIILIFNTPQIFSIRELAKELNLNKNSTHLILKRINKNQHNTNFCLKILNTLPNGR